MKVEWNKDKNAKILSTDTNGDGKPDIFDYYFTDSPLRERKEDRNFDGKFDKITLFPVRSGDRLIVQSDDNFDGIFERLEERWREGDYIVIHIKIDTKSRGVFDFETTDRVNHNKVLELESNSRARSANKKKENSLGKNRPRISFDPSSFDPSLFLKTEDHNICFIDNSTRKQLKNIQGLSKIFSDVAAIGPLSDDFYLTDFGVKIQKACVDMIGSKKIVNTVSKSLKKGLACLWELESPQSKANVHKIASLLLDEKNPPKIICDEIKYDWGSQTMAHASVPGDKGHPTISFSPSRIKDMPEEKISETFFHEIFHNIGYVHRVDIEYPYSCDSCCFNKSKKEAHVLACQICKGQYSGTNDRKYVEDLTNFFSLSNKEEENMGVLMKYLEYNPQDNWGRFRFISANSTEYNSPLAVAFVQALKSRNFPMTSDEISETDKIERTKTSDYTKLFAPPARLIAESLLSFLDGNLEVAAENLKKIQIPDRVSTSSVEKTDYEYMSGKIKELDMRITLMISKKYEASGNNKEFASLWKNYSMRNNK